MVIFLGGPPPPLAPIESGVPIYARSSSTEPGPYLGKRYTRVLVIVGNYKTLPFFPRSSRDYGSKIPPTLSRENGKTIEWGTGVTWLTLGKIEEKDEEDERKSEQVSSKHLEEDHNQRTKIFMPSITKLYNRKYCWLIIMFMFSWWKCNLLGAEDRWRSFKTHTKMR